MADPFPTYEVLLNKRGRSWKWRVCTTNGDVIMLGSESSRPAARYKANSALLLLLLSAPYRLIELRRRSEPRIRSRSGRLKRLPAR